MRWVYAQTLIVLQGQMERTMLEETKNYLMQLVIDLHNKARVEENQELRKVADDISEVLKKDKEKCYT